MLRPFLFTFGLQAQQTMVIHHSFAEFVLFLYVHMAHADGDYHNSEVEVILKKIPKLFPDDPNPSQRLDAAVSQYLATDPSQVKSIIRDTFRFFDTVKFSQKYKVYTDMFDIINADGRVDDSETQAMNELKSIIDLGSAKK
jgi:uncharacterized tellurite resistance protein B-like protein